MSYLTSIICNYRHYNYSINDATTTTNSNCNLSTGFLSVYKLNAYKYGLFVPIVDDKNEKKLKLLDGLLRKNGYIEKKS